ncbi:hypothetical protein Tco_0637598 [Tanacetum coccineum]
MSWQSKTSPKLLIGQDTSRRTHVDARKHIRKGIFALNPLLKRHKYSHAGNPCAHLFDPTVKDCAKLEGGIGVWISGEVFPRRLQRITPDSDVITDKQIRQNLSKPENSDRLAKWMKELGEHNICYRLRTSIHGQVLADFLSEVPTKRVNPTEEPVEETIELKCLFTDGSSNVGGFRVGLILTNIKDGMEVMAIMEEEGGTWMTPIKEYLENATLPQKKGKARRLKSRSKQYVMLEGVLYRKSFLGSWLRCVGTVPGDYVIKEIHEGSCSMHFGPRSIMTKAMQLGFYWLKMHIDARMVFRACEEFQVHRPIPRLPKTKLTPITSWPFHKLCINICGSSPEVAGKVKFLIVAINYFTNG